MEESTGFRQNLQKAKLIFFQCSYCERRFNILEFTVLCVWFLCFLKLFLVTLYARKLISIFQCKFQHVTIHAYSCIFHLRTYKSASPKLFRALNFTPLNISSYTVWLVLTLQLLQFHTKILSQYFGMVMKQLPRQNKSNSIERKV